MDKNSFIRLFLNLVKKDMSEYKEDREKKTSLYEFIIGQCRKIGGKTR